MPASATEYICVTDLVCGLCHMWTQKPKTGGWAATHVVPWTLAPLPSPQKRARHDCRSWLHVRQPWSKFCCFSAVKFVFHDNFCDLNAHSLPTAAPDLVRPTYLLRYLLMAVWQLQPKVAQTMQQHCLVWMYLHRYIGHVTIFSWV